MTTENQECCPIFNIEKWDKKTFSWDNKRFIKESIPAFFHIPFTPLIGKRMTKMMELSDQAQANIPDRSEALVLFHDPSAFQSEIYYSVTREVQGTHNTTLSGTFLAGVFEGPYNAVPKHIKTMNKRLEAEHLKAKGYYVHYAYCPGCAKEFGHNYMVLFAKVN